MATKNIYWGFSADGKTFKLSSNSSSPATNLWVQDDSYAINNDTTNMKPPWQDGTYNLSAVTTLQFNTPQPYYTFEWFMGFSGLTTATININMKNVIVASKMFQFCKNLTTLTLNTTNFCINKLVYADEMFMMCEKLSSLTTTAACWTTSSNTLKTVSSMFEQCFMLSDFSFLKNFKTANLEDISFMLCEAGAELPDGTKITVDITGWDLSSLRESGMFKSGVSDVVHYNSPEIEINLKNVVLGEFVGGLFEDACCLYINGVFHRFTPGISAFLNADTVNTSAMKNMNHMFDNCTARCTIDIAGWGWDISNVETANYAFAENHELAKVNLSNLKFNNLKTAIYMFYNFDNSDLEAGSIDLTNADFSKVTSFRGAFSGYDTYSPIDLSQFIFDGLKTSDSLTDMSIAFRYSSGFNSKILSYFNTSNVTTMWGIFQGATGLSSIYLNYCDLINLNDVGYMFNNSDVKYIDISALAYSPLTSIGRMFNSCTNLKTIYTGGALIDWSSKSGSNIFDNCTSLVGGNGTTYNSSHDKAYARCDLVKGNAGIAADQEGYFSAALTMNHCLA